MPFNKPPLLVPKPCAELVEASVWEHHCRETEFLVHYTPKQEFGSEQLKDIFQNAKLLLIFLFFARETFPFKKK
jgi:hypothetical protein